MKTAPSSWDMIVRGARTATDHARIYAATLAVPEDNLDHRAAAHARMCAAGAFADLDVLKLTASQITELAAVASGGTAGVNAQRIDGQIRPHLVRLGLIAKAPSSRYPASDWRATVRATPSGVGTVRAAQGQPVTLTTEEAVPLAVIERAMRTRPERGVSGWPGSNLTMRVAQMWALMEFVRAGPPPGEHWASHLPAAVHRLTPAGLEALERHRLSNDSVAIPVTTRAAEILARVQSAPGSDLGQLGGRDTHMLQKCMEAGWVSEGKPVMHAVSRRKVHLTPEGQEALERWRFQVATEKASPPQPSWPVTEITAGQWVALSNRRGFPGVASGWVKVVEVKSVPRPTQDRLSGNYEVWVTDEERTEPYLYANRSVYRTVRFYVRLK